MGQDSLPKSLIVVSPQQDAALHGSLRALRAKVGMKTQENMSFLQSMWAQIQGALQPPSGTVRAAPRLVPTTAKPPLQTHRKNAPTAVRDADAQLRARLCCKTISIYQCPCGPTSHHPLSSPQSARSTPGCHGALS